MKTLAALVMFLLGSAAIASPAAAGPTAAAAPALSITRLDCGTIRFKDFGSFFSDTNELPHGGRTLTDSCYLIHHHDQHLLWDTGLPAALKGNRAVMGAMTPSIDRTLVEQLALLGLKPGDIDIVGISHMHLDHVGQVGNFAGAKLIVGKGDFEATRGKDDPFSAWRGSAAKVELEHGGDIDVFGDGSVIALNTPGHTPDHMSLLVKLASGNVLLTGDLYHSALARTGRQVPGFNTSRADTLASIDRFERLARSYHAKVIIQHEPADIAKLPAFPAAAR